MSAAARGQVRARTSPSDHSGRDPRLLPFVVGNGLATFAGLILAYLALTRSGDVPAQLISIKTSDFTQYYNAARLLLEGHGSAMYDFRALGAREYALSRPLGTPHGVLPYLYPPYFIVVLAPLALLPYTESFLTWLVINCCLLAAVLYSLERYAGLRGRGALAFRALTLCFFPVFLSLGLGQVSVFLLALFTLGFFALAAGRDYLAGAALAAAALKPQYVIPFLLVILVRRRWKALLAFLLSGLTLAAIPAPWLGTSIDVAYVRTVLLATRWQGHTGQVISQGMKVAPATYAPVWNHGFAGFWQLLVAPPASTVLTLGCSALLLLALAALARRGVSHGPPVPLDLVLGMAMPVGLLISPHTLGYDLTLLLIPATALLRHASRPVAATSLVLGYVALLVGYPLAFLVRFQLSVVLMCGLVLALCLFTRAGPQQADLWPDPVQAPDGRGRPECRPAPGAPKKPGGLHVVGSHIGRSPGRPPLGVASTERSLLQEASTEIGQHATHDTE